MARAVVLVCALAACGRLDFASHAGAGPDGGGNGDAAARDAPDDAAAATCWSLWGATPPPLTAPVRVPGLGSDAQGDPELADGGLTLYFADGVFTKGIEVYTTRPTLTDPFDPTLRLAFNTGSGQSHTKVALTADGTHGVVSAQLAGSSSAPYLLYTTSRVGSDVGFTDPDGSATAAINAPAKDVFDPDLSPDGLTLYYAPTSATGQVIARAQRTTIDAPFGSGTVLSIAGAPAQRADPSTSPDGTTMLFSAVGASGLHVSYATRDGSGNWTWFGLIPELESGAGSADQDAIRSADGCSVWFSSSRDGTKALFTSEVVR